MLILGIIIVVLVVVYYLRPNRTTSPLQSLSNQATYLTSKGSDAEAIIVINKMIAFDVSPKEEKTVALAMLLKIDCLSRLASNDESQVPNNPIPSHAIPSYPLLVDSSLFKNLRPLRPSNKAIIAFDDFINRFKKHNDPEIKELVLMAIRFKEMHLVILGDSSQRIENLDLMIDHYGNDDSDFVFSDVIKAIFDKAKKYEELNQFKNAIQTYDILEKKFDQSVNNQLNNDITFISAMVNKSRLLNKHGRRDEALENLDKLLTRYKDSPDVGMEKILIPYADILARLELYTDSHAFYKLAIELLDELGTSADMELMSRACIGQAIIFEQIEDYNEAFIMYDKLINSLSQIDDHYIQYSSLPIAYVGKAIMLERLGRTDEAKATLTRLENYESKNNEDIILDSVARAYGERAKLFFDLGWLDQAAIAGNLASAEIKTSQ